MEERLRLAVIIPTYKRPAMLGALLDSLEHQIRLPDEVIVACRDDDHPSQEAVRSWAGTSPLGDRHKLVTVSIPGHLPPLAAAVGICESDIFCQIDDDAVPYPDWLDRLEQVFGDPAVGGVCGKVVNHLTEYAEAGHYASKSMLIPSRLSWFGRSSALARTPDTDQGLFAADCFHGGNMAFRTRLLTEAHDMRMNGGSSVCYETDVARHVAARGLRLYYDPLAVVDHYPAPRAIATKRGLNADECYWHAHNLTYVCLKHLPWYGKLGFMLYFFLGGQWECPAPATYLLGFAKGKRYSLTGHLLPALRGRLAGVRSWLSWKNGGAALFRQNASAVLESTSDGSGTLQLNDIATQPGGQSKTPRL